MKIATENHPENLAAAYKEISGGEVLKPSHFEGAGDASLSPSHVHGHTPALSLGAVRGSACAPVPRIGSQAQPDPLATPGLLRFLLGPTASAMLADAGEFFTIQAKQSPRPEDGGRFILFALPVDKDTADASARVALGKARAVTIKTPTTSKP